MPIPRPCPSDPVDASIPGSPTSGWVPKCPPGLQYFSSSERGITPSSSRTVYWASEPCPLERMNVSGFSTPLPWCIRPKYTVSTISRQEKAPAMCSAETVCDISRMRLRSLRQRARSAPASNSFAAPFRRGVVTSRLTRPSFVDSGGAGRGRGRRPDGPVPDLEQERRDRISRGVGPLDELHGLAFQAADGLGPVVPRPEQVQ